jgi:hypothetical protein
MEVAETERCEKIQHVLGLREIELAGDSAWPAPTNKKLPTTSANKKTILWPSSWNGKSDFYPRSYSFSVHYREVSGTSVHNGTGLLCAYWDSQGNIRRLNSIVLIGPLVAEK